MAFAPDGRTFATGGADGTVMVLAELHRQVGLPLTGHPGEVWGAAFTPDGRTLATANANGLWDLTTTGPTARALTDTPRVWWLPPGAPWPPPR